MTTSPRRAEEALDRPFRGPERLALALPLMAALGLTIVMAATAVGESTPFVALAAAAGFFFCGLAPVALLQTYVGRPLRLALAHLRAARDGVEPPRAAPASGVIADLVAVARDIHAGRAHASQYRAGVALCENMAAAGDEAIRAFRLQCEELAETTAGESQLRSATQVQFAEIAEALKAIKAAAPAAPLDNGVERIEQMLVYLAESLERREQPAEGADRVEGALTDIVRLIGREAQALRDTVSAAALNVRNDIAGAGADDRAARDRQQERLETLEARVLTRFDEVAAPGIEAIRSHAETTRLVEVVEATASRLDGLDRLAAVVERIEAERAAPADAVAVLSEAMAALGAKWEGASAEALARGLDEMVARLREHEQAQAGRLDEIEARLVAEAGRDSHSAGLSVLAKCTDKLRNALDRFDVLSAAAASTATAQTDDLRGALRTLEAEVAGFGDRLGALDLTGSSQDVAPSHGPTLDALRAEIAGVAPRLEAMCDDLARRLGERLDALDSKSLQPATRDLAALQARSESFARQIAVSAAALAALAERDGLDFDALRAALEGADAAFSCAAAAMQAQAVHGNASFADGSEAARTVAMRAEDAQTRLDEALAPLDALAPAITAIHILTQALEASAMQISTGVEGLQAFAVMGLKSLAEAGRLQEQAVREDVAPELTDLRDERSERAQDGSFDSHAVGLGLRDDDEMQALRAAVSELIALGG